ncbi:MAG: amidohydrolase [Rhizobiaceae bacterium]|nr:amidohydrolase [Rhizobiaceae bacterium]
MPDSADIIIVNGRVRTMDPDRPRVEAVAAAGGRIVALGDNASIHDLAGPTTRVIDAGGASVLPGFIEGHMHLFSGAAELAHLQLHGVHGFEALETAARIYAALNPDRPLVLGQSADYTILGVGRSVTRHDLDRILPDRPFALAAADHHTMWANTKALEAAGILHGKAVGPGNEVVMGSDGRAAGELREGEAFGPVLALAREERCRLGLSTGGEPDPMPTPAERDGDRAIMRRGLDWCARHGITSIHNMDGNLYQLELLSEIEAAGDLACRVKIPFHFKNFMDLSDLEKASRMAGSYRSEWLSSGMVKMFYDGVLDSWTAVMLEDYADRPGWRGEPLFSPERFAEIATEIDRRGLQIAVHAIGDGAVRAVLDGYEAAAKANGRRDSRHRIEHIELTTQADIARFAPLGVIASMQPAHPPGGGGFPMEPTVSRIGRARWADAYPVRTLQQAGASIVFASDWPVAPIDPLLGMRCAVERTPWAEALPSQNLTLDQAIAAYTSGGAYAEFAEHRKGRLRPGYLADIVVLDADIDSVETERLNEVSPRFTICGGRITFAA